MKRKINAIVGRFNGRMMNNSQELKKVSRVCRLRTAVLLVFLSCFLTAMQASAQEKPQVFSLPEARVGEAYRVKIEDLLREKYGLKLETSSARAILLWSLAGGEPPPGISVQTDGAIVGTVTENATDSYEFSLKVVDASVKDEQLSLNFSLGVRRGRLRLAKIQGPRLVPVDMQTAESNSGSAVSGNEISSGDGVKPSPPAANTPVDQQLTDKQRAAREVKEQEARKAAKQLAEQQEVEKAVTTPFSGVNKRFIVGFEQAGAAASDSTGKPFFDIFINTPLSRKHECSKPKCLPRFSVWGDVRLTSTAEQVNALADVSADSISAITGSKLNQIASAFDFTVGPEVRLRRFYNTTLSLIAGFGAVSPVSPKQSAQIFEVPDKDSPQRAAFLAKFPGAKDSQQIAFISPDRDRFLRQYFGGFRFKTYNICGANEDDCKKGKLRPTFPATFDVTFGQNEAVTGGRLHKFVVGLDGFYPLPFPDNKRFLYLFGSARLKAGGPKNNDTPFILATAASSVKVTDDTVFIADPTPTNRDTYRIGFGVDLFELFKFAKDKGKEQGAQEEKTRALKAAANPPE